MDAAKSERENDVYACGCQLKKQYEGFRKEVAKAAGEDCLYIYPYHALHCTVASLCKFTCKSVCFYFKLAPPSSLVFAKRESTIAPHAVTPARTKAAASTRTPTIHNH